MILSVRFDFLGANEVKICLSLKTFVRLSSVKIVHGDCVLSADLIEECLNGNVMIGFQ
jgi:hypothetical protein